MTKAFKATRFASVPYELMDVMPERGGKQIVCVYLWLHRFGWCSDQGCWASLATISHATGIRVKDVQQALRYLIEQGWVVQTPRPGRTSLFSVRMHRDEATYGVLAPGLKSPTTPVQKSPTTPVPKRPTNKNPGIRTQEQEPKKGASAEKVKKDPNRLKKLPESSVPADLSGCGELLIEFWSVKKGVRSTPVLHRICKKLRQWSLEDRRTALERAIASGWGDVFPPKKQGSYRPAQEPEHKHPAHRVFKADRGFDDEPVTNPVLKDFF
jgi:hypothetical protein